MNAGSLTIKADNSAMMRAVETFKKYAQGSPEMEECFAARFPNLIDTIEAEVIDGGIVVLPSAAFISFMQDLL